MLIVHRDETKCWHNRFWQLGKDDKILSGTLLNPVSTLESLVGTQHSCDIGANHGSSVWAELEPGPAARAERRVTKSQEQKTETMVDRPPSS